MDGECVTRCEMLTSFRYTPEEEGSLVIPYG